MQANLSNRPYIEVLVRAEQAVGGGASPAYAMKYLIDSGVEPALAEQAVLEATKNVQAKRQYEQDLKRAENKEGYKWALIFFVGAMLFFGVGFLLQTSGAYYAGLGFVALGFKKLRSTWLDNNNYT